MKNAVIYTFPRSEMLGRFSSPSIKYDLLKELEETDGWISTIHEVTMLGVEVVSHEFPIIDEAFNILATEWEKHFKDPDMHEMLEIYCLPEPVLKPALEKLKTIKELFTFRIATFLSALPEGTMILIEAQDVEDNE